MEILGVAGAFAIIIPIVVLVAIGVGAWFFYVTKFRTKKAQPNEALIVTGRGIGAKNGVSVKQTLNLEETGEEVSPDDTEQFVQIVRGGVVRLKFLQEAHPIPLRSFQIPISVSNVTVKQGDTVDAEATVQISVGKSDKHILNYAQKFLGKADKEIEQELGKLVTGHFRAILPTMTVDEINANREKFSQQVREISQKSLDSLGFEVHDFTLGSLEDSDKEGGYLANVERKRKAVMLKEAENVESESEKERRIKRAEDEKIAKEIENQRAIELAESEKAKSLREAQIKQEIAEEKAKAEFAEEFARAQKQKELEEERNKVELTKRQGQKEIALVSAEEEKEITLKRAEQQLEEERKRQEKLKVEAESQAQIELVRTKADADAQVQRAKAEADKEKLNAEAEAQRLALIGKAEAEAILQKGTSEAKAKELMTDALLKGGDLHLKQLAIETAPLVAEQLAKAIGAIGDVKIFSTGSGANGEDVITGNVTNSLLGNVGATYELLKETTGIDLKELAINKSKQHHINLVNEGVKANDEVVNGETEELATHLVDEQADYTAVSSDTVVESETAVHTVETSEDTIEPAVLEEVGKKEVKRGRPKKQDKE